MLSKRNVVMILLLVLAFPFTALAQAVVSDTPPDQLDLAGLANLALQAITSGNYWALAALAVIPLVDLARRFGGKRFPFLLTKRGGALLAILTTFAGALFNLLIAGAAPGLPVLWAAVKVLMGSVAARSLVMALAPDPVADLVQNAHKAAEAKAAEAAKTPSVADGLGKL